MHGGITCLKGDTEMSRAIKINIFKVGIILSVLSCVSACGQKGDLYLPPESAGISAVDYSNIT
jgi:Prokaryotic lipoprotein-attachment site